MQTGLCLHWGVGLSSKRSDGGRLGAFVRVANDSSVTTLGWLGCKGFGRARRERRVV